MLENNDNEINLLITWYERAKEVAIEAESLDSLNKGYIQPLHEQRYCLDHFVRAIVYEKEGETDEKVKKAISSAIGHLQRAYSDSIEWILISVKDEYLRVLKQYTNGQINQGFPEYYSEIRPAFDKITEAVNQYKVNKSVENATIIDVLSDDQVEFLSVISNQLLSLDVVKKLKEYLEKLYTKESILIEIQEKDRKQSLWDKLIIPTITAIVAAVVGGIIVALIM